MEGNLLKKDIEMISLILSGYIIIKIMALFKKKSTIPMELRMETLKNFIRVKDLLSPIIIKIIYSMVNIKNIYLMDI